MQMHVDPFGVNSQLKNHARLSRHSTRHKPSTYNVVPIQANLGEHSSNIKIVNPGQLNNAMYAMRPQLKQKNTQQCDNNNIIQQLKICINGINLDQHWSFDLQLKHVHRPTTSSTYQQQFINNDNASKQLRISSRPTR